MASPYADRRRQLDDHLAESGTDTVILSSGPNCQYLTGFAGEADRELLVAISVGEDPVAITAEQYAGQVRDNADVGRIVRVDSNDAETVVDGLHRNLGDPGRLLLDENARAEVTTRLLADLGAEVGLVAEVTGPMRIRKEDFELENMRRAAAVADEVSEEIRAMGAGAVGMTEADLAVEIRTRLHAKGGERLAFPVSLGAGPNGARPTEYRHGDRTIQPGDPVVIDFGTFVDGYASDQTRTCVFAGDPPDGFQNAYDAAKAGLDAGAASVAPGMTAAAVDGIVREAIDEFDLADRFIHGTGHGVGLDAHEPPAIVADNDRELREGMVFSIEPGIYLPGEFGVRVEDLVVVTADGCERLNGSPYTWQPL